MKVALLFPPQWTAAQPYFGLTALNGQLRRAGHDVVVRDLNLEFVAQALSTSTLRLTLQRLAAETEAVRGQVMLRASAHDRSAEAEQLARKLLELDAALARDPDELKQLLSLIDGVADGLRDADAFYDPHALTNLFGALDAALRLTSLPFYPASIKWNDFYTPLVPYNLAPMVAFCQDPLANPYYRFLEAQLPGLLRIDAGLYALSINAFSQVLPGLTLARALKAALATDGAPAGKVVLGGNFFGRLKAELMALPEFFANFADGIILGEGERSIVALADHLDPVRSAPLEAVPRLLYLDATGGEVICTPDGANQKLDAMAFQSLEGFPVERYLAPERVLCVRASKSCYYGKCAFCDSFYGLEPDTMQVERLVAELRHLRDHFGVRHFEFVDQCIEPRYMRAMCEAFIAADLNVRWFCNGRTERGFDRPLLDLMVKAGCTMVLWGVESGSERLLKLMHKGISTTGRMAVLRDADAAGLFNFAYIFFGFPTETEAEAQSTIDLICQHTDVIHAYGRSVFTLGKHAPLMADLKAYGVLKWVEDRQELSTNLSFEAESGLQGAQVDAWAKRCQEQCHAAYGNPLWMALRSRENLHLYLARRGKAFVQSFRFTAAEAAVEPVEFVF